MLEKLFNMILWVDAAFTRTRDPVIEEYREYQRHMIAGGGLAVITQLGAWFLMPANEAANGVQQIVHTFAAYVALGCLVVSAATSLWCAWSVYQLWRFTRD
jgi:hypothetical protein